MKMRHMMLLGLMMLSLSGCARKPIPPIELEVGSTGAFMVNGAGGSVRDARAALIEIVRKSGGAGEITVNVRAPASVEHRQVRMAMDVCAEIGIWKTMLGVMGDPRLVRAYRTAPDSGTGPNEGVAIREPEILEQEVEGEVEITELGGESDESLGLQIFLTTSGIMLNGKIVTMAEITTILASAVAANPDATISILASEKSQHDSLVALMAVTEDAGIKHYSLFSVPAGMARTLTQRQAE